MESNPLDIMKLCLPLMYIIIWSFSHFTQVTEKQNIGLFSIFDGYLYLSLMKAFGFILSKRV